MSHVKGSQAFEGIKFLTKALCVSVQAITSTNRTEFPWLLVIYHAATYHTYTSGFKEYECHRQIYEPLFVKYGVDVVMSGHVHGYERTKPIINYQVRSIEES